ncbi:MAG: hypothetical protein F6K40_17735 [Okeania sp. SIO3I5]|uniref:hypothetical protein n=1 Tax=Okeania sp. SIO3I5 TaxID=2607805 RepID=UPI0013B92C57|nr:hypothetical protein [Okeania sp. SIO3I5]NEQ38006.1 hypothetical protein [Okeania sp. SIO3I5]
MSTTKSGNKSEILTLAKQGNATAIASVLNYFLKEKGITTQATILDNVLCLTLKSLEVPDKKISVSFVNKALVKLGIKSIHSVKISGQDISTDSPQWTEFISLYNQATKQQKIIKPVASIKSHARQQNTKTNPKTNIKTHQKKTEQKKLDKLMKLSQCSLWLTAVLGLTIPIATYIYTKRKVAFYIWFFVFGIFLQGILSAILINFLLENTDGEDIFIKAFYLPFLIVSFVSIIDNCMAIKRARKQTYLLTKETPWKQKRKNKEENQQTENKANKWPAWFPYPSSWLKSLFLLMWTVIIIRVFDFWSGIIGLIFSEIPGSETLFLKATGLGLILSIVVLSYVDHIFSNKNILFSKKSSSKYSMWVPHVVSIWQGFYGHIVLVLTSIIVMIILLPFLAICDYQTFGDFGYCTRMAGTKLTNYDELIGYFGLTSWLTIVAYFYQIEYWLRKNFSLKDLGKLILTILIILSFNGHISIMSKLLQQFSG